MYDIIIAGGGPAGLTAATYARRAGKSVLVIEKSTFGGQITWSPRVENFPTVISATGAELGDRFMEQAMEQGADLELEEITEVRDNGSFKTVVCETGVEFEGRSLIIAAGARPRMLGLAREEELVGSGVCYCAVCDGAFYSGKTVAVYGGGNSALQDALLLSEKCAKVYLIHRRDSFRGEAALVEQLRKKSNVELVLSTVITALEGVDSLTGITVLRDGSEEHIALDGLFVAIGHQPDLGCFANLIGLDEAGYADSGENCLTRSQGVFVAGDCRRKSVRQLTTAVADGAVAALAACSWLDR